MAPTVYDKVHRCYVAHKAKHVCLLVLTALCCLHPSYFTYELKESASPHPTGTMLTLTPGIPMYYSFCLMPCVPPPPARVESGTWCLIKSSNHDLGQNVEIACPLIYKPSERMGMPKRGTVQDMCAWCFWSNWH